MWLWLVFSLYSFGACEEIPSFWEASPAVGIPSQEKTEWCFAHAVANLFRVKIGKEVDARDLAMRFHLWENPHAKFEPSRFERVGGFVPPTLRLALSQGVCAGSPCASHFLRGGWEKGMEKKASLPWLSVIDKVLEEGEPLVLSLDMGFLRERGKFPHAVLIVGRRQGADGECQYLAVDSNRPSQGWHKEYYSRNQEGRFYLNASEVERFGIRFDYVRGKVTAAPVSQ